MADFVTLRCPNLKCRVVLKVPDAKRGECVRCGVCGHVLRVPKKPDTPFRSPPPNKQITGP